MKKDGTGSEKQEQAMKLMEALSGVDGELIERSEGGSRGKALMPVWRHAAGFAAVLCLAVAGAAGWGGYRLIKGMNPTADYSGGANGESMARVEDMEVAMEGADLQDGGDGMEAAPREPEEGAAENMPLSEEKTSGGEAEGTGNGTDAFGTAGSAEGNTDSQKAGGEETPNGADGQERVETDEVCSLPNGNSISITKEEARSHEALGSCIPTALPEGYVFESACLEPDREEEYLRICWTRGMDYITLSFEKTGNPPDTVDISRAETYDERLYKIPYAETVPAAYLQSVNDPVFALEDLTLEVLESRMLSCDDSGDTDTPRGNFRVLCPNGVLVRFSGRGTAQEIWEMFCSMEGLK